MSRDTNSCIIIGRITKKMELRYTPSGAAVTDFSLAVNDSFTSNGETTESVSFINFTAWGKTAEALVNYTDKGHRICTQGKIKQHIWDDPKTGAKRSDVSITVDTFQFLQPKGEASPEPSQGADSSKPFSSDDIPFSPNVC